MGLGKFLLKGVKGVASAAVNEVSSTIGLASEMEKYSDSRLRRIAQDEYSSTKEKSAAAYVLKKRGY